MTTKDLISKENEVETYNEVHRLTKIYCKKANINTDDAEDIASDLYDSFRKKDAITIRTTVEQFLRSSIKCMIHVWRKDTKDGEAFILAFTIEEERKRYLNPEQTDTEINTDNAYILCYPFMVNRFAADCKKQQENFHKDKVFDNCGEIIQAIKYIKASKLSFENLMNLVTVKQSGYSSEEIYSVWENLGGINSRIINDKVIAVVIWAILHPKEMSEENAADKLGVSLSTYKRFYADWEAGFEKLHYIWENWEAKFEMENLITERNFDGIEEVFCYLDKVKIEFENFLQLVINDKAAFPFPISDFPKTDYK